MPIACTIGDFRILRPKHLGGHDEAVRWLASAHAHAEAARAEGAFDEGGFRTRMERLVTRYGCNTENLAFRGFEMDDFINPDWGGMRVFNVERDPNGAGMSVRMEAFQEVAERAFAAFYPEPDARPALRAQNADGTPATWGAQEAPDELIHVSCTGYVAPSAAQLLVAKRGWRGRTGVVHAYHMGCYASMPALRMASAFLASPRPGEDGAGLGPGFARRDAALGLAAPSTVRARGRIDIVHTEFCSLHLNPSEHMPEQLVAQSLFADGHIRYSVRPAGAGDGAEEGFRFLGVYEEIVPDTASAVGWRLGDHGMRIGLSRDVPDLIAGALGDFLDRLFARTGTDPREAVERGLFAVHPGGPRIIDKVAGLLGLKPQQVAHSRAVLKACGNMSSATLPHVWAGMLADAEVPPGTLITSLAFGPGLTLYGAILRKT
jgi:predicted naringenin-chalcone synthase